MTATIEATASSTIEAGDTLVVIDAAGARDAELGQIVKATSVDPSDGYVYTDTYGMYGFRFRKLVKGDRVVVSYCEPGTSAHALWSGPATVREVRDGGVSVITDKGGHRGFFQLSDVTLLVEEPKVEAEYAEVELPIGYRVVKRTPRVGDRIRSAYSTRKEGVKGSAHARKFDGIGTITEWDDPFFKVEIDNRTFTHNLFLYPSEFDVIDLRSPRVGDFVKAKESVGIIPAGAVGEVTEAWVDGMIYVRWSDEYLSRFNGGFWSSRFEITEEPTVPEPFTAVYATVEDEQGLRALGKGAVIQSSANGATYVKGDAELFVAPALPDTVLTSTVFGAIRSGLVFTVLNPGQ